MSDKNSKSVTIVFNYDPNVITKANYDAHKFAIQMLTSKEIVKKYNICNVTDDDSYLVNDKHKLQGFYFTVMHPKGTYITADPTSLKIFLHMLDDQQPPSETPEYKILN